METKDIIILAAALGLAGYSFYRKYARKQIRGGPNKTPGMIAPRGNLRDQPDDYEPYDGKNIRN